MAQPAETLSYLDYLALERGSETKHEWIDGAVYAMAGGSYEHARLAASFLGELRAALRGRPCSVLGSDMRVRILTTRRATYPDASVVCGKPEHPPDDAHAIVNPVLLAEVTSESTEASDRGEKWAHYQRLPSLQHYLLLSQTEPRIELFTRAGGSWTYSSFGPGDTIALPALDVRLAVDAVYADPAAA